MAPPRGAATAAGAVLAVLALVPGCSVPSLPPLGQLRLSVDTDAPVPAIVSRVRVDVFSDDGRWIDSRDASLRDRSAWPASFTIFAGDPSKRTTVRVRVRAYAEGALRDYRGERYLPTPPPGVAKAAMPAEPPATDAPRLVVDGRDVTPRDEPLPTATIDRLIAATLEEGRVSNALVILRSACAGTMADLAKDRTCVDTRGVLTQTPLAALEPADAPAWRADLEARQRSLPAALPSEIVVPGGIFVLGSREQAVRFVVAGVTVTAEPERVFVVPPLLVDRTEVTVGRFRAALAEGFVPPDPPIANDEAGIMLAGPGNRRACTFSTTPLAGEASREELPLTCVTWRTARAFCKRRGADLPTEAAYEWLAAASGRAQKTAFPWGDDVPSCDAVVFGRLPLAGLAAPCGGGTAKALGPLPVGAGPRDTSPDGVHGLAGNVLELARDAYLPYAAACWARAPLVDPGCEADGVEDVVARGSGWASPELASAALRVPTPPDGGAFDTGFRCVRK